MLSALSSGAYSQFESLSRWRLDTPENMMRKVSKVAIPAVLLLGAQAIEGASAFGCVGCAICVAAGGPACAPLCLLCGLTWVAPLG